MVELTIGYVSGIIAAIVFAVRVFIPTASTFILAGLLKEENTATTWSVVARSLQSSHWPALLRSDSQSTAGLPGSVNAESYVRPILLFIVSVASIITPLGLYDAIVPKEHVVQQSFGYSPDSSAMGIGTPPRSTLSFNRHCGSFTAQACPGSNTVISNSSGTIDMPYGYDARIPQNLTDAFQSGLPRFNRTVSSIWDIQWRSYDFTKRDDVNNGSMYIVGAYRQLSSLVLNDAIEPVEGLIVDMVNGGAGFRNHTTPSPLAYGGTWSDDLLFVEPETKCVDMNVTLEFLLKLDEYGNLEPGDLTLTDRGGFTDHRPEYPAYNHDDPQSFIDLEGRAYKAAWLSNAFSMFYLNVSNPKDDDHPEAFMYLNSTVGKEYPLSDDWLGFGEDWKSFQTSGNWGNFLDIPSNFSSKGNSSASTRGEYPNPFKISSSDFEDIKTLCEGAGGLDFANITNVGVVCGMVYGAARPQVGQPSLLFEPDSYWTVPLYSCASAAKAIVKTVDFIYNGTDGLKSLKVTNLRDKTYPSPENRPLWGVENTQMQLQDGKALWGLVSEDYKGRNDISTIQKEHLWLPGWGSTFADMARSPTSGFQNLPGVDFHTSMLQVAYGLDDIHTGVNDYTGKTNIAMYRKWQDLSANVNTTAKIINLIWTDLAANGLVGTRGWLSSPASSDLSKRDAQNGSPFPQAGESTDVGIILYHKVIRYNWPFAIPGFIALFGAGIIALGTAFLFFTGRARPSVIRKFLNHTSVGRVLTTLLHPGQSDSQAPTKQWVASVGLKRIDLGGHVPKPVDPVMMPNYDYYVAAEDSLLTKNIAAGQSGYRN